MTMRLAAPFAIALLFAGAERHEVSAYAQEDAQEQARYRVSDTVVEITPGSTTYGLVRTYYPDYHSRWLQVAEDLAVTNPRAFRNGDPGAMIVGRSLKLIEYRDPATGEYLRPSGLRDPALATLLTLPRAAQLEAQPTDDSPLPIAAQNGDDATTPAPAPPPRPSHALARIGSVERLEGVVIAIDINNMQRMLALDGAIFRGDAILTDGGTDVSLRMIDEARIDLKPDSRLVFENYTYIPNGRGNSSILTLLRGGFRAITGLLGKRNPRAVLINSPVATIGIRGTDFGLRLCGRGECRVEDMDTALAGGLYSGVLQGQVSLTNNTGELTVGRGEFYRVRAPDTAPEPAPEAASLLFSRDELAGLEVASEKPMTFWQWFKERFF